MSGGNIEAPIRLGDEANKRHYQASDLAKDQEGARRRLAYWLLALLSVVAVSILVAVFANWISVDEAKDLAAVVLSPIVVLTGTALGFYFGGNNSA